MLMNTAGYIQKNIEKNIKSLKENSYPGRGIVIGLSPDSKNYIQIYWIMGRSPNSRNRIFVNENSFIKTAPYDPSKIKDPSLIIYYPAKHLKDIHIVSNGDQTDTIYDNLKNGISFEAALNTRTFEPDAPHFTPRISGIIDLKPQDYPIKLAIIKPCQTNPDYCTRQYFYYEKGIPGTGHCIHTYASDGEPLPPFYGEPLDVVLFNKIDEVIDFYWDILNNENKISILVKFIDKSTGKADIMIKNKNVISD